MGIKSFFNFIRSRFFWVNIGVAVGAFIIIVLLTMWWLKGFTHHGESVEVPDLSGLYVEEAEIILHDQQLGFEVIDSVYLKRVAPGEITEQSPSKGTKVKKNRKVYLTINAKGARMIPVPELRNISYRQARITLKNMGFVVDSIVYKPSEFADLVMDVLVADNSVAAGTPLKEGANLVLVVGTTDSDEEVLVPNLRGMTIELAREAIAENQLIVGIVDYDSDPATAGKKDVYYIYDQEPRSGEVHRAGKRVNLWLSRDKNHKPRESKESDEDFFN